MNPRYLGDSFDIVKKFFCGAIRSLGYDVFVDAMFTGSWQEQESAFYAFLGAKDVHQWSLANTPSALFLDPDTGVNANGGPKHASYSRIVSDLQYHSLVFAFDQSFSRQTDAKGIMRQKLIALNAHGCHAFFYNSHARSLLSGYKSNGNSGLESALSIN